MSEGFARSLEKAIIAFMDSMHEHSAWLESADEPPVKPYSPPNGELTQYSQSGFVTIRRTDPDFDLSAFLLHVGEMFSAYHSALDRGELAPVRRFIDEEYYPEVEVMAREAGRAADGPRPLQIRAIHPSTAQHEDGLDLVRVSISALQGDAEPQLICEYWELIRKRGTITKPGLSVTHCPNCGGPVDGIDPTRCAYCNTRLADPALDWVVRKITEQ